MLTYKKYDLSKTKIIKFIANALILYFFISDFYFVTHGGLKFPLNNELIFYSNYLRFALIIIAIPALYLVRIFSYLGLWPKEIKESNLFQAKLFYNALYLILIVLIIVKVFQLIF